MMKNNRINFVLLLFALSVFVFTVSVASADTCADLFPSLGCDNGGCADWVSNGNCIIYNCWCPPKAYFLNHDCNTGEDSKECTAEEH